MCSSETFLRNENYIWRIIDGETIIMSPYGDKLYALNDMGTFIWELLDGSKTIEDIVSNILKDYDIEKNIVYNDVIRFIEKLLENNILVKKTT
ncbi:MAG: PqqD family protein [bacterium]